MQNQDSAQKAAQCHLIGMKIRSIKKLEKKENVYCLSANKNRTMIANGIITKNCDALRYAIYTHFGKSMTIKVRNLKDDLGYGLGYNPEFHPFASPKPF